MKRTAFIVLLLSSSVACSGGQVQNTNSGPPTSNNVQPADVGPDQSDDDHDDGPSIDGGFGGAAPMTIIQEGTDGLLLQGLVLTPNGLLEEGHVLVVGTDIVCVDTDCTADPDAGAATWIATGGIISPGLIDSHNHVAYNFLPEWKPPGGALFENRYEWADDPSYEAHVAPYATHRVSGSHFCPAAKWGELRSLIHGTTTIQGQSPNQKCIQGAVRNADHHHELQYNHMRTMIGSPRDVTDDQAQNFIDSFTRPVEPTTRMAIHMQEGYAGNHILTEFESWAGRDERDNRHRGTSLLYDGTSVLIHSMSLTEPQLDEVEATNAKIVWSPSSNMVLYGRTAPIEAILQRDITVGLGPDWTVSGEANMLGELRFAHDYAVQTGVSAITPERLWRMSTDDGATVVGLDGFVGRIEVGYRADITVFSALDPDPHFAVIQNRAQDIGLVLIDGEAYYGAASLREELGRNDGCEPLSVCDEEKFLCVKDPTINDGHEALEDVRQRLVDILEGNGFPPEEQYGRGDELLELFECD